MKNHDWGGIYANQCDKSTFTLAGGRNRRISCGLPPKSSLIAFLTRSVVTSGFGSTENGANWTERTHASKLLQDRSAQIAMATLRLDTLKQQVCNSSYRIVVHQSTPKPRLGSITQNGNTEPKFPYHTTRKLAVIDRTWLGWEAHTRQRAGGSSALPGAQDG